MIKNVIRVATLLSLVYIIYLLRASRSCETVKNAVEIADGPVGQMNTKYNMNERLTLGSYSVNVKELQRFLNNIRNNFTYTDENGNQNYYWSVMIEDGYFDEATQAILAKYAEIAKGQKGITETTLYQILN